MGININDLNGDLQPIGASLLSGNDSIMDSLRELSHQEQKVSGGGKGGSTIVTGGGFGNPTIVTGGGKKGGETIVTGGGFGGSRFFPGNFGPTIVTGGGKKGGGTIVTGGGFGGFGGQTIVTN